MSNALPWLVIGQGAIGSLMAIRLAEQGLPVQLKLRQEAPAKTSTTLTCGDNSVRLPTTRSVTQACWIFAAVKAYDVAPLLRELHQSPAFRSSTLVLSYNGMLNDEATLLRPHDLHWVTTHGAYRELDRVVHAGHGQSWLGTQQAGLAQPQELCKQLAQALPPLTWDANIATRRWHKLAVNCLINPFTVVHHCRNGELLQQVSAAQWQQVAEEIVALAAVRGIELEAARLIDHARQVASATAANRSSMLQDYRLGRTTEISYLNGFIASASTEAGLTAPANAALAQQVLELSRDRDLR